MRTVKEIYAAMIAEKEAVDNGQPRYPALTKLNSTSATAIYKLIFYIVAYGIWLHEGLWVRHIEEIETLRAATLLHTKAWLIEEAKRWQYGSMPEVDDKGQYNYKEIDESRQLVDYASISETPGRVWIKVAHDNSGNLEPLNCEPGTEVDSLASYLNKYRAFPGQVINIISMEADLLKIDTEIYYNGVLQEAVLSAQVLQAINDFLKTIPFDGVMKLSALIDSVQEIDGVEDVKLNSAEAQAEGNDYSPVLRTYNPSAGHMKLDETNSLITYVQN